MNSLSNRRRRGGQNAHVMDGFLFTGWLLASGCAVAIFLAVLGGMVRIFNRLVRARNACGNAWSGAETNLKKRHDLIPNLVRVVEAYADHEETVLAEVAGLRERASREVGTTEGMSTEGRLGRALFDVRARVEAYPQLQANEQFLHLAATLNEVEEQISASRRAYNAAVQALNNLVEQFPSLIVARMSGFKPREYFAADPVVHAAPGVSGG
ncbi:MAG: LemA family protein [Gammaproteobacteria bacterium]|nr:LemA family protein [Gammaproteobacteria bacterium]